MTLPVILLVSGSRILADDERAARWARGFITRAWDEDPRPTVVVTGDARGPDTWARIEAVQRLVPFYCYASSGRIVGKDGKDFGRWTKHDPPERGANRAEWAAWLLHRDRVMAQHVARRFREGATARVLALVHQASPTKGTDYTVGRCRALGLNVQREEYAR